MWGDYTQPFMPIRRLAHPNNLLDEWWMCGLGDANERDFPTIGDECENKAPRVSYEMGLLKDMKIRFK